MFMIKIILGTLTVTFCLVFVAVTLENRYLKENHCKPTGNKKEYVVLVPYFDGTTSTVLPQVQVSIEYQCDNGLEWR